MLHEHNCQIKVKIQAIFNSLTAWQMTLPLMI